MRIGVTGHQRLSDPAGWDWVEAEIERILDSLRPPLVGLSSLAIGADQLLARAVLRRGGSLEVIVPFTEYETTFTHENDRREYLGLLERAITVEVLPLHCSAEEAYLAAGKRIVDLADFVVAVWNGQPALGLGGTGDIVNYIKQQSKRAVHLNPITEEVRELVS